MLIHTQLTDAECLTLQELAKHHPFSDCRLRALGMLALAKGYDFSVVADILGVSLPTPYNWLKAWKKHGLMGLLTGHQGGAPVKLTKKLLDTAEKIARDSPCTLGQIAQRLHEIHPDAPRFSLDRLSAHLKKRGLTFMRSRLSIQTVKSDSQEGKPLGIPSPISKARGRKQSA